MIMVMGKMVLNKSHKYVTTVSFYISTVLGIESNNFSLSRVTLGLTWNTCDVIIKSTIFKKNAVIRGSFSKVLFISKVLRNSITHH